MNMPLWLPWVLSAGLASALAFALSRLYSLRVEAGRTRREAEARQQLAKMSELLGRLMNVHDLGSSDVGEAARQQVCRAVLDHACELMGSERGSLMLLDPRRGELAIVAARGLPEEMVRTHLKPGEGVAGKVFASGEPAFIADPQHDPRYVQAQKNPASQEPVISIPVKIRGKAAGVLNLHRSSGAAPFDELHLKFLNLLAAEAGRALENLGLYDDLHRFYLELVESLSRAMDMKDNYTHQHCERARRKARRIAERLGMPEQMVRCVEFASLLHDIGKIGIDDAILTKPGKLTPEEYEIMKKHPAIGYQIVSPVNFLGPVAQIVLHHQEWYNGQGYPEQLKGEEIPLGSRIVAVTDAWDAMTSDRPYRKALGREKAISELRKGAGTQFDAKVVEIFLELEAEEWKEDPTIPLPAPKASVNPVLKPSRSHGHEP